MTERQGVEIDYCPECRGVWLDRGELDKILERSYAAAAPPPPTGGPQAYRTDQNQRHYEDKHHFGHNEHDRHKRKSWLTELFD
ncbi:zf-TFIIB domain-containing protein [Geomonas paludis]|uniref:Zf-TFIIB domain-containing protein n=1 Tax=Geomonas paludis TaxID=2740185 RepID=A0A6V8MVK4_9BACT|nr:zf-TFIIB domain-containing protein [Geomonas paludis]GFO64112.1 hypothetical protein GMPD_20310 [Geomonas paludis]